jgi:hypothetical protein
MGKKLHRMKEERILLTDTIWPLKSKKEREAEFRTSKENRNVRSYCLTNGLE